MQVRSDATSRTAAPAPTTQGMSSDRAMMAVCAVGPPDAVQSPRMRLGSSWAVSEEVKSSATRIADDRATWCAVLGASEQTQDALADVVKIRSSLASRSFSIASTPPSGVQSHVATTKPHCGRFNLRGDLLKDLRVVQKRQVRAENRGLTFARLL